tara:strand:- start:270 stop:626 length:357 start_codon:yes stop_codon:yes gene_type:complete
MSQVNNWVPEICYEEEVDGISSHIPFIQVPTNQFMPKMLFIFESRETGEMEPGLEGEPVPVVQLDLHQYADMATLKENLSPADYDNVRFALGLEPLKSAAVKGSEITQNIRNSVENNS